jgi:hypothetical protein
LLDRDLQEDVARKALRTGIGPEFEKTKAASIETALL